MYWVLHIGKFMKPDRLLAFLPIASLSLGCGDIEGLDQLVVGGEEDRVEQVERANNPNLASVQEKSNPENSGQLKDDLVDSPSKGTTDLGGEPPSQSETNSEDVFPSTSEKQVADGTEKPNPPKLPENIVEGETPDPAIQPKSPADQDPVARKLLSDKPEENLEVLNMALKKWIQAKGELPERLEQLVMEEFLPMLPMEPVGHMFTIDRKTKKIVLVRQ